MKYKNLTGFHALVSNYRFKPDMFWYIGDWYFLSPPPSSWITYFHSWQKEACIYYHVHRHLQVQCLWNDTGLLPHGQIMCSLRNNYQLESYKMGQQFSAHCVVFWPPNTAIFLWFSSHQSENYVNLL